MNAIALVIKTLLSNVQDRQVKSQLSHVIRVIRDLSSEAAESSRRWLTQLGCRWSQEHTVVLKCDIILPSVGGK